MAIRYGTERARSVQKGITTTKVLGGLIFLIVIILWWFS